MHKVINCDNMYLDIDYGENYTYTPICKCSVIDKRFLIFFKTPLMCTPEIAKQCSSRVPVEIKPPEGE